MSSSVAAYLWSVRSSPPRRPPQFSWTGNTQAFLSSLQQQNARFTIKRNTSKLGEQDDILILNPHLRQELQAVTGNPMFYLRRADENEEWWNMRQEGAHRTISYLPQPARAKQQLRQQGGHARQRRYSNSSSGSSIYQDQESTYVCFENENEYTAPRR